MPGVKQRLTSFLAGRMLKDMPPRTHTVRKTQVRVPMRDGVELLADLYVPTTPTDKPTIVVRSPYGRGGFALWLGVLPIAERGYPVLMQSCRGTFGSGGTFTPQVHDQDDGVDTLRWVRAQPWFTGSLLTFGASYLGYVQWAVAGHLTRTEPAAAADGLVLITTMPDFGAITWQDGAFALRNALGWTRMVRRQEKRFAMLNMLRPDPELEKAFDALPLTDGDLVTGEHVHWYQDWLRHDDLADPYWTEQSHTASVADVTAPVMMATGWYDIFLPWQLRNYEALVAAGNPPELTVGPWGHISPELHNVVPAETLSFVGRRLTGDWTGAPREHPVKVFVTGADEWRGYETWPPPGVSAEDRFLLPDGGLDVSPKPGEPSRYTYDPADPTPALGGPTLTPNVLPVDNAEHEKRSDVLVFTSDVLAEPLEVTGEPVATVWLRTDRPTTDVFVRLCDVHPDGRSMTVCDGIRRIGGRGTVDVDPAPDESGAREVRVSLWPTGHRFAAGHRVRVQVSSGAHPRYARNTGDAAPAADATTLHLHHQEVLHDAEHASHVMLPVLR